MDIEQMHSAANQVAEIMRALCHKDRLLLLCQISQGEKSVGELENLLNLHQPSLSQQLGILREEGLVSCRREGKRVFYTVADEKVLTLLKTLYDLYCPKTESNSENKS